MYENFLRNVITVGFILNFLLNFWCVCVCVCVKILEQHDGRKEKSIYFKQTLLMSSCNPKF